MINLIAKTPDTFTLDPVDPENPTQQEIEISNAVVALGVEFVLAGIYGGEKMWSVITRSNDLQSVIDAVAAYGLPITVIGAQDAHGPVIHLTASKTDLLNFMQPDRTYYADGNIISETPASVVSIPVWGGHSEWVCYA